jgi:hypothetical protein
MNGDEHVEQTLHRLMPRGAAPELREHVLAAVGRQLSADGLSRWERRLGLAVAASILLGIVLNVWANKATDRRLARLYGPRPVPRQITEVAEMVASVTDAETGRRLERQLAATWQSHEAPLPYPPIDYSQFLREFELVRKGAHREDLLKEGTEMDRDRRRRGGRDTSDCQRDLGLADRLTA